MSTAAELVAPPLDADRAGEVVRMVREVLIPMHQQNALNLDWVDLWAGWSQEVPKTPQKATLEHRRLAELSRTPWLGLVVTTVAQSLSVDGFRSPDTGAASEAWRIWQANRMDAGQIPLHRAALTYGCAFQVVERGTPVPRLRGVSPRRMSCLYADPVADEWPMWAIEQVGSTGWRVWDTERVYMLGTVPGSAALTITAAAPHGAPCCPVVRHAPMIDLEGRTVGEVEPYIHVAQRINKTMFDRMLAQHFNSWKVRTAAGLDLEASADPDVDPSQALLKLSQSDMLVAKDPTTRFGTLDETPLGGFIEAYRADIETLAAVSQTPAYSLTGTLVNLSADAIAAARAPLTQKIQERKTAFGESHAQALRLAALMAGDDQSASDYSSRITWQDMEVRSLSAAVDALGKAVTMLGVPAESMWERLPGVTQADVEEWQQAKRSAAAAATVSADGATATAGDAGPVAP